jgi:ParB family transcriptional regulator, chromosome partitioning protein
MQDPRAAPELRELALEEIEPNFSQPRYHFDEVALEALAGSLREHGVLQPVLVRPRPEGGYELVAGERRWRAAEIAGLDSIPALVCEYDDAAALEVALIENMAREDLNIVEEIRAFATLRELGLSHREIGERVGRSTSAVGNIVRMLDLSEEILGFLERGELRMAHGVELLAAKDPEVRDELARRAVKEGWTVMSTAARARESNEDRRAPRKKRQQTQYLDEGVQGVAKAWGDVLRAEVQVRPMAYGRVRLEVQFASTEAALYAAGRQADALARSAKDSSS